MGEVIVRNVVISFLHGLLKCGFVSRAFVLNKFLHPTEDILYGVEIRRV
jgi:hypothetical protein